MCLEFDLTHLKLEDVENSFHSREFDDFSMNQFGQNAPQHDS